MAAEFDNNFDNFLDVLSIYYINLNLSTTISTISRDMCPRQLYKIIAKVMTRKPSEQGNNKYYLATKKSISLPYDEGFFVAAVYRKQERIHVGTMFS